MGRQKKSNQLIFTRLSRARRLMGLTRTQLAERLGVHYQTIGYLERGEFSPSLVVAIKLSEILSCPIDEIFSLTAFDCGAVAPVKNNGSMAGSEPASTQVQSRSEF